MTSGGPQSHRTRGHRAEYWNDRYARAIAEDRAERPPSDWLFEHEALLAAQPRGPALDVACGLGRNALYLARLGFETLAVDSSRVATEYVARRAREESLPLRAQLLDAQAEALPAGPFEVVVNTFFLERNLFGALREALAPGGLLFFVTFLDGSFALAPGELREQFSGLKVLDYREGPPLPGDRPRASLLARRGDISRTAR